jgi:hypothetical protein
MKINIKSTGVLRITGLYPASPAERQAKRETENGRKLCQTALPLTRNKKLYKMNLI